MTADKYVTKKELDESLELAFQEFEKRIMAAVGELLSDVLEHVNDRFDLIEARLDRIEDKLDRTAATVDLHGVDIRQLRRKLA